MPPWISLAALLVLLAPGCGGGAEPEPGPAPAPVARDARLVPDRETHDFGAVYPMSVHTTTFDLVAEGTDPLVVKEVVRSCGCTRGELSVVEGDTATRVELGREYAPGTKFRLDAELNTKGKSGRLRQTVGIALDDAPRGTVLTLYADIAPYLIFDPPDLAITSFPERDAMPTLAEVMVRARDGARFALETAGASDGITASLAPTDPDDLGQAAEGKMTVQLEGGPRLFSRSFKLLLATDAPHPGAEPEEDGSPARHKGEFLGRITVKSRFHLPADLPMGEFTGGLEVRRFSFRNLDRSALVPEPSAELYADRNRAPFAWSDRFRVAVETVRPGREWTVVVTCDPGPATGPFSGVVGIAVDDPEEILWVPFEGEFAATNP